VKYINNIFSILIWYIHTVLKNVIKFVVHVLGSGVQNYAQGVHYTPWHPLPLATYLC